MHPELEMNLIKARIMAGEVRLNPHHVIRNASELVPQDHELILEERSPFVSRGAFKIKDFVDKYVQFSQNTVCIDVGASTGGFTDLLIQRGARRVYAVDAGYGHLHQKLRQDPRVINLEKTNARDLSLVQIPEPIDLLVADVSFINLEKVIQPIPPFLNEHGYAFLLIKPQFEAERHEVEKGGVIRDEKVHQRIAKETAQKILHLFHWKQLELSPATLKGTTGNQEYVLCMAW